MRYPELLLMCLLVLIVGETTAYAYTDPGSGVLIWQILLAAFIGVMFYTRRIIAWTRRLITRNKLTAGGTAVSGDPGDASNSN